MTGEELRQALLRGSASFTLSVWQIKELVGEPVSITLLPRFCSRTHRDLVHLVFAVDDGEADVFGVVGQVNGEEVLCDGWVVINPAAGHDPPAAGSTGLRRQLNLFGE